MKRMIAITLAAVLAVSLSACSVLERTQQQPEETPVSGTAVEVQTVKKGDMYTENVVTGNVLANRDMPVMPKISCKVKTVEVKAGEMVEKGDTLFTLDTSDVRDLYAPLLSSYNRTKTLLDEQVRQTEESLSNLKILYEMGAVSRNTVEQTELGLLQAKTNRDTTLAQMGADDVLEVLSNPAVKAPITGTVTSISVTPGVITSNTGVAAVISEIGRPQVVVNVSEQLVNGIHVGDSVEVEISALRNKPFTGVVSTVSSAISQSSALYPVHIDLPEGIEAAAIGMFAKATFRTDARYRAVLIPTEAILNNGTEQYVFVVEDGEAYRVTVTTGLVGEKQTEILSGLEGGETLVTRGQSYLSDGAPVRITGGAAG